MELLHVHFGHFIISNNFNQIYILIQLQQLKVFFQTYFFQNTTTNATLVDRFMDHKH
jgi:hypothetical protein